MNHKDVVVFHIVRRLGVFILCRKGKNRLSHRRQFLHRGLQPVYDLLIALKMRLNNRYLFLYGNRAFPGIGNRFACNLRIRIGNGSVNSLLHPFKVRVDDTGALIYRKWSGIERLDLFPQTDKISNTHKTAYHKQDHDGCI